MAAPKKNIYAVKQHLNSGFETRHRRCILRIKSFIILSVKIDDGHQINADVSNKFELRQIV